jgi:hypothetical protein
VSEELKHFLKKCLIENAGDSPIAYDRINNDLKLLGRKAKKLYLKKLKTIILACTEWTF